MFHRCIELAFHLVAVGGLARVVILMEHQPTATALSQTVMVCVCLLMVAATLHIGMKMVNRK